MQIHADMDLDELIPLMGERYGVGVSRYASQQEASDLRDLLVRDFPGKDTYQIDGGRWHHYCCAVHPTEQE